MNENVKPVVDGQSVRYVLDNGGPLAQVVPEFAPRRGQMEMALAIARTLRQGVPLVVEAGTGTGKTLAYLAPALLSGLKVIVSTGTRTLQDQVNQKELPLLARAMFPDLSWAVLKGRSNYLCLRRYTAFAQQPDLGLPGVVTSLARLKEWREESESGDLDEVRGEGVSAAVLSEVTANGEQCLGGRCPRREECRLMEARRKAVEAQVVVVNHHLFLADLKLREEGHGEVLPRYQAVVFDEAHLLPEVATQAFGVSVSSGRLSQLLRDMEREVLAVFGGAGEEAKAALACQASGRALFGRLARAAGEAGRLTLAPEGLEEMQGEVEALEKDLSELARALVDRPEEESKALGGRAAALALDLSAAVRPAPGHTVAWVEARRGGAALHLSPVEVGPHLREALYGQEGRLVFTSATLAVGGDLNHYLRRMGLDNDTHTLVVPSPFDPAEQTLLYVPRSMPAPAAREFPEAVAREVAELVKLSGGRAFVLFTSHRNLDLVVRRLEGRLPYTCLVQGTAPRLKLLRRFVEESPAVLFATASFWQGVDVPGPALSAVIVDKLPFAPPDDPLVAARVARLEGEEGMSGFAHILVPEAILSLKQGLGRLIRTAADRGVLAVLDARLVTKPYGRRFLKALAPIPVTHDKADVAGFFAREKDLPF